MAGAASAPEVPMLRGRREERALLDGLLARARGGHSGVLVLRGEAGFGKTALLEHAVQSASDLTVLRAVGLEPEVGLAFAALHRLCAPVLDGLDRLPGPQRDALAITFGLNAGQVPDRLFVGLATLSLLSEAAQERPLLCVIDDAQWLDRASAQALAFVARRLRTESLVMLFAARAPTAELTGLRELVVEGLDDADARMLLASVIPGRLDERVADQLVAEARGNPLALRGLSPSQLAGGFGLPRARSLESRIEQSFGHRLEALPRDTRRLLLVAAAEPTGDPGLLWRAAERLHICGPVPLDAAETAGLIEVDSRRVRFRHPLVRSVLYRAATPRERSQAHRALAAATDAQLDPDRRAWHRAESTGGPDEDVAAELERAAGRVQARGGWAAAAAFLERAAALTPDPPCRAQRALAAAQAKYESGAITDALTLLATAEAGALGDLERARVDLLRSAIAFASRRDSDAPPLLLKAARKLEGVDVALARATYLEALQAALLVGRLARGAGVAEVSEAALACPAPPRRARPPDLLLEGLARQFTEGFAAGAPILREALSAFRQEPDLPPSEARWLALACRAAADTWDDETWRVLSERDLENARRAGALTAMPLVLSTFGYVRAISGEVALAESLLDEIRAATEATGVPAHYSIALWVAALRGREDEFSKLVETTTSDVAARGEGFVLGIARQATAALNNGLGRYDIALNAVREAVDVEPSDELGSPRTMPELIEAAVRSGEHGLAERALERLAQSTRAGDTDWGLGLEARSRALLTDGDAADGLYRESIERLARTRNRLQLARAHLLYGEWLRRERRRAAAREQLRTAFEMFTSMGTEAFAGRAERELLAAGERVRRSSVETRDELTAQEAQIARLARDGLSNAAIGARLFISQHTVAYHLRKVFSKLHITSRNQLGAALPG
jgi:DNA-binding CsgD family transcriptional regulator